MNEIAIRNVTTFTNKELNAATKKMCLIAEGIRRYALETAAIVAHVAETECFKDDGFNSVHEWVESTFGIKKSASYVLLKIGAEYLQEVSNAKGKVTGYVTNIAPTPETADYSVTQIEKMLPGGHDLAFELSARGEITPAMTCKEIESVIKKYTKPESEVEEETVNEVEDETENEAESEVTIIVVDEQGNQYAVPVEILEKYRI